MGSPYKIVYKPAALRALKKLPNTQAQKIVDRTASLGANPYPPGHKKLSSPEGFLRIRVGDYRVVYLVTDDPKEVLIVRVGHRSEIYRGL